MSKRPLSDMSHADLGAEARRLEAELEALRVECEETRNAGLKLEVERRYLPIEVGQIGPEGAEPPVETRIRVVQITRKEF